MKSTGAKEGNTLEDSFKKRKFADTMKQNKKLKANDVVMTIEETKGDKNIPTGGGIKKMSIKDYVKLNSAKSYYLLTQDELLAHMFNFKATHGIDSKTLMSRREQALFQSVKPWFQ